MTDVNMYDEKGRLHCETGPAYLGSSHNIWYRHGKKHRLNGPAVVYRCPYHQWANSYWVDGTKVSSAYYEAAVVAYLKTHPEQQTGEPLLQEF